MNIFCTVCPESLNSAAVKHGLDECGEDSLFTGIIVVAVVKNYPNGSFSVKVAAPGRLGLCDGSKHYEISVNFVLNKVVGKGLVPCTCPVSECS